MVETMGGKANLLHFAAERGYKQFAAYLLAESGGAYDAMSVQNKRGLTPANIAESRGDEDITQLFIDYEVSFFAVMVSVNERIFFFVGLGSCRRQRRAVDGIRRLSEVDERVQLRENGAERRGREDTEEKEKKQEKCG